MSSSVFEKVRFCRLLALAGLLLCAGCASTRNGDASERVARAHHELGPVGTIQWAQRVRPYALMSELTYRGDRVNPQRKACQQKFQDSLEQSGWVRLTNQTDLASTDDNAPGLHYYIWENRRLATPQIVVAFRGTEWWDRMDWKANTRWLRPISRRHDEYAQARAQVCQLLRERFTAGETNWAIVTAGHSLGGGLAQAVFHASQALPENCRVTQCYTFDASPVTGVLRSEAHLMKKAFANRAERTSIQTASVQSAGEAACASGDFGVVTVYQRGEILACLRALARPFRPPSPTISELRFNFATRLGPFRRHRMCDLADSIYNCDRGESATH